MNIDDILFWDISQSLYLEIRFLGLFPLLHQCLQILQPRLEDLLFWVWPCDLADESEQTDIVHKKMGFFETHPNPGTCIWVFFNLDHFLLRAEDCDFILVIIVVLPHHIGSL